MSAAPIYKFLSAKSINLDPVSFMCLIQKATEHLNSNARQEDVFVCFFFACKTEQQLPFMEMNQRFLAKFALRVKNSAFV